MENVLSSSFLSSRGYEILGCRCRSSKRYEKEVDGFLIP